MRNRLERLVESALFGFLSAIILYVLVGVFAYQVYGLHIQVDATATKFMFYCHAILMTIVAYKLNNI